MAAFLAQTKLPTTPEPLCSGTSAQLWASEKGGKTDETEIDNCPVTETLLSESRPLTPGPSLAATQCEALLERNPRGTVSPSSFPAVT